MTLALELVISVTLNRASIPTTRRDAIFELYPSLFISFLSPFNTRTTFLYLWPVRMFFFFHW